MGELSKLPNIGKVIEGQLNDVGIFTIAELKEIGSKEAWLRLKENDKKACFNKLRSLEAAIQNIKKSELSENDKKTLREFYNSYK